MRHRIQLINKEAIDKEYNFYRKLGLTHEQSDYLSKHVFGMVEYFSDKAEFEKEQEKIFKSYKPSIKGASFGGFGDFGGICVNNIAPSFFSCSQVPSTSFGIDEDDDIDKDTEYFECGACVDGFDEIVEAEFASSAFMASVIPNKKSFKDRERYNIVAEGKDKETISNPVSTFSATVNTAAYGIIKDLIDDGEEVPSSIVRTEELLNFFDYDIDTPNETGTQGKFNIHAELFTRDKTKDKYMLLGLKGRRIESADQNMVFLLDVSGSMEGYMQLVQKALMQMICKLKSTDTVSIVTYADSDKVVFTGYKAGDIDTIIKGLSEITMGGCTNGSAGLNQAYNIIEKYYISDGSNRVVLITDGDFNFGTCNVEDLKEIIKEKKVSGAYLTIVGVKNSGLDDKICESLARNGNGNYFIINDNFDIEEVIGKRINSLINTLAKDVKVQVEFNPKIVKGYKLIGYESRELSQSDFRNDKIEAEPVGSEHVVIALYKLTMNDEGSSDVKQALKYQQVNYVESNDIATVCIRYKEPTESVSVEQSKEIKYEEIDITNNARIALAVMILANRLRKSADVVNGDYREALSLIEGINTSKVDSLRKLIQST